MVFIVLFWYDEPILAYAVLYIPFDLYRVLLHFHFKY